MTLLVAQVSVATGIAPNELLECSPDMFLAIVAVLKEQARQQERR